MNIWPCGEIGSTRKFEGLVGKPVPVRVRPRSHEGLSK